MSNDLEHSNKGDTMQMFKSKEMQNLVESFNSEADINNQLGQMNDFFEPHKFTECTDQVMDYNQLGQMKIYESINLVY